jgi:hypothetical protein
MDYENIILWISLIITILTTILGILESFVFE